MMAGGAVRDLFFSIGWDINTSAISSVNEQMDELAANARNLISGTDRVAGSFNSFTSKSKSGLNTVATSSGKTSKAVKDIGTAAQTSQKKVSVLGDVFKALQDKASSSTGKAKKNMSSAASAVSNGFDTVKNKIMGIAAVTGAGLGITGLAKEAYSLAEASSDLGEAQNVVENTFKKSSKAVEQWTETTASSAGISKTAATKYVGSMGAMLKSSGLSEKTAQTMSEKMVQLTGDMSSFYNLDNETTWNKIRAGIIGETMPLRELGINMTEANLQAFAMSKGIKTSYKEMSAGDKTILRYNYLLSTTKDAQGDFARTTSASMANQSRVFEMNIDSMKTTIGNSLRPAFLDMFNQVNPLIQKMIPKVGQAVAGMASSIKAHLPEIKGFVSNVLEFVKTVGTPIIAVVKNIIDTIVKSVQVIAPHIKPIVDDIGKIGANIVSLIPHVGDLKSSVVGLVQGGMTALQAVLDWMANHGAIVKGVVIGLVSAFVLYKGAIAAVNVVSTVHNALQIVSAARTAISTGATLAETAATKTATGAKVGYNTAIVLSIAHHVAHRAAIIGSTIAQGAHTAATNVATGAQRLLSAENLKSIGVWIAGKAQIIGSTIALGAHQVALFGASVASKAAAAGQWLFNAALNANPIGIVVLAIGALVAAFVVLWNKCKPFKNFFIGMWNGIRSGAVGAINGIIGALNAMIGGLNRLKFNVPSWVPIIGGKSLGFSIPRIPTFAKGTKNSPDSFIAGDAGPELVTGAKGSTVYTATQTKKLLNSSPVPVEVKIEVPIQIMGNADKGTIDVMIAKLKSVMPSIVQDTIRKALTPIVSETPVTP